MTQQQQPFNMPDSTNEFDPQDIEANKVMGGLAYILFFLPLIAAPQSKYARFHSNQGLLLVLLSVALEIVIWIISLLIFSIFSYGLWAVWGIVTTVLWLGIAALGIIGLINGFTGKAKELPIIRKIKIIK